MKNIYIIDDYQTSIRNGIGTYLQELIGYLESLDASVWLIEFNSPELFFCIKKERKVKEMHFPPFMKNQFLAHFNLIEKFFQLYIKDSPDNLFMLHHSPCENLLKSIKNTFPLSKTTFTIHDFGWTSHLSGDFDLLKKILSDKTSKKIKAKYQSTINYFQEEQRMYEITDKVICLSEDAYRLLQELYLTKKNKISMIPNGLTDTYVPISSTKKRALKAKMGIHLDEKILLVTGRATWVKGIPSLLKGFTKVVKEYGNCRLVIVGQVYDPSSILKLSKQIAAKVTYTGLISKKELSHWYRIADIGVVPSLSEQCSYAGIEMMMYGLPIIASDGFGVRTMFQDGINARIANIGNRKKPKEFASNLTRTILELLSSETLCKTLMEGARRTYLTHYVSVKMWEKYKKYVFEC